jgi:hypothetical protein
LDTTVYYHNTAADVNTTDPDLDTFIITGDIEAMWLRDSSNQVLPYIPYATEDPDLQVMLEGLIARQAKSVVIDPFANAFNFNASGEGHQSDQRKPPMGPAVFEGKYEIDSLCAFLKLSYWHFRYSGDGALTRFATSDWFDAVAKLLDTGAVLTSFKPYVSCVLTRPFKNVASQCNAARQRTVAQPSLPVRPRHVGGSGHAVRADPRPAGPPTEASQQRTRRYLRAHTKSVPALRRRRHPAVQHPGLVLCLHLLYHVPRDLFTAKWS